MRRLAEARGFEPVVYEEVESAAKARPVLDRMLADVRAGRVQGVAVWAIDRLHRSMVGAINTILELDRLGVPVMSVREGWLDTSGPVRPLLVAIFGWVAEQERARLESSAPGRAWSAPGGRARPLAAPHLSRAPAGRQRSLWRRDERGRGRQGQRRFPRRAPAVAGRKPHLGERRKRLSAMATVAVPAGLSRSFGRRGPALRVPETLAHPFRKVWPVRTGSPVRQ